MAEEDKKQDSTEVIKLGRPKDRKPQRATKQRKIFSGPIVRVTIAMEEEIWKRLKMTAIWENRTLEDVINEGLEDLALRAERQREAEEQLTKALRKKRK